MQNQHKPVLIFAQSGRFLAQSAIQNDYRVWVADCFGDQDTLDVVERWTKVPELPTLTFAQFLTILNKLTRDEPCLLICGSGIEYFYPFLNKLPDHIQLISNTTTTVHAIRTPSLFFSLLHQLNLAYPKTVFERPINDTNYIVKSSSGLGGNHIQFVDKNLQYEDKHYFQQQTDGNSGSVLFLANGSHTQLISINRQYVTATNKTPYRLGSIETPWKISTKHRQHLCKAIAKITAETGLVGLNSLDFILSIQGKLLILEVNPRPSASVELVKTESNTLFQYHINACLGILPDHYLFSSDKLSSLRYLYADNEYRIPANTVWPLSCKDIPKSDSIIKKGEPICTSIVHADSHDQAKKKHLQIERQLLCQFVILK